MAINISNEAWAVKLRGRSFMLDTHGYPRIFKTKKVAEGVALLQVDLYDIKAEPVRIRVRIEEV